MLANEQILEERRAAYNEQQRIFLAQLMSERGGVCMKGASDKENECKMLEYFKNLQVLDMKYIDIVRDDYGLDPGDPTATFGDDLDRKWDHFFREHIVQDDKGKPTILYKDKEDKFRLIPNKFPDIQDMEFVIDNFEKIVISEDERKSIDPYPSVTIMGIEGLTGENYQDYYVEPEDSNFYVTQIMMLTGELLDVLKEHKEKLKESGNELFKILEQKYKEVF